MARKDDGHGRSDKERRGDIVDEILENDNKRRRGGAGRDEGQADRNSGAPYAPTDPGTHATGLNPDTNYRHENAEGEERHRMGEEEREVLIEQELKRKQEDEAAERKKKMLEMLERFNLTPEEVKTYLDKRIISQERPKRVLSVGVAYHFRRTARFIRSEIEREEALKRGEDIPPINGYIKENVLLIGPTGCGKSYSVEKVSELVKVPFVKEDITKFTASGYVGRDVDELAKDLMIKADGDVDLARVGIVYLDEIDKIAKTTFPMGKDVNGLEVQTGLLKILEGSEVMLEYRTPFGISKVPFNTKYVLFVASGAFSDMQEIYEKQEDVSTKDLTDYGFEPEFIGRFPVRAVYKALSEKDLVSIMKDSDESPLRQYTNDMTDWGINLSFDDSAIREIAKRAYGKGVGARGIVAEIEASLLDYKFELPKKYTGDLVITADNIINPSDGLKRLLKKEDK